MGRLNIVKGLSCTATDGAGGNIASDGNTRGGKPSVVAARGISCGKEMGNTPNTGGGDDSEG